MATNWFLGLVASGFPVSGPQVPHNFCFHLQTQAEHFLSSTSTWINPLAKLVFTWAYRMIEPYHPYEGHFASCSHIIICLYGDLHVITCIQLHFPITTSRPWGEGGSPGVTGLPQGPQQQPSPKDGWQAIPDGTGLQPKGYVQHMICLDMKNAYLFRGFQVVLTTKINENHVSHVWSHWNYPSMACWIVLFPSKDYPRIQMHMFHIALTYIFNKQPIKGCLPQCVNQNMTGGSVVRKVSL